MVVAYTFIGSSVAPHVVHCPSWTWCHISRYSIFMTHETPVVVENTDMAEE